MSSKIRFALPLLFIIITIIVLGCSSPEEQGFTLKDVQGIGYQAEEDITKQYWKYDDLLEAWDGNIAVNGKSQYLGVLIFKGITIEGYPLTNIRMKSGSIDNIAVACEDQSVCNYVTDKLNSNKTNN